LVCEFEGNGTRDEVLLNFGSIGAWQDNEYDKEEGNKSTHFL